MRFIAAWHIIAFHIALTVSSRHSCKSVPCNFALWGQSWVTFFFLLSGFMITYSQLQKPDPSQMGTVSAFMTRRLASTYPLYLSACLSRMAISLCLGTAVPSSWWTSLPLYLLMVQTWTWETCANSMFCCQTWSRVTWYIADLVFYWLCFFYVFPRFKALSDRASELGFLFGVMCTCVWPCVIYLKFGAGDAIPWEDPLVRLALYHPFSFAHVFWSGMCLAKVFVSRSKLVGVNMILRCSSELALAILILAFLLVGMSETLVFCVRSGMLLPVQALFLWGLAAEDGVLPRLLCRRPLPRLGDLSLGLYVLQDAFAIDVWMPKGFWFILVPPAYVAAVIAAHRLIEKPMAALCMMWLGRQAGQEIA